MLRLTILPLSGGAMCPVVLDDGEYLVLVDCGLAATYEELCQIAELKGVGLSRLTHVILTHHDHDHIGGLPALKAAHPDVIVAASPIEKDYIEGSRKPIRMEQAEARLAVAEESEKPAILERIESLKKVEPVKVDVELTDGMEPGWCGVKIVATPGHMPGHVSVYVPELQALITGDAMNAGSGTLQMANPAFTLDMDEAAHSIEKLIDFDLMQVICYHGGVFTGNVRSALSAVVTGYRNGKLN